MRRVEFYRHSVTETDIAAAADVLRSVFLTTGPRAAAFERAFAEMLGVEHVVTLSSCTSALFLSLKALGVGPGDEVITTPMTFAATANAVLHTGATPVFVDVEDDFAGHGIGSPSPWINDWRWLSATNSFHPNASGYVAYAGAIRAVPLS